MEVELTNARELRDQELNEALDPNSTDELDDLSIQNKRLARIQEYEDAALDRPDPLAAMIGMETPPFNGFSSTWGSPCWRNWMIDHIRSKSAASWSRRFV